MQHSATKQYSRQQNSKSLLKDTPISASERPSLEMSGRPAEAFLASLLHNVPRVFVLFRDPMFGTEPSESEGGNHEGCSSWSDPNPNRRGILVRTVYG